MLSVVSVMNLRVFCLCGLIYDLFTYLHHFSWDSTDVIRTWAGTGRPGNRGSIPARSIYNFPVHRASKMAVAPTQPATEMGLEAGFLQR
jgi:hypothetical protein